VSRCEARSHRTRTQCHRTRARCPLLTDRFVTCTVVTHKHAQATGGNASGGATRGCDIARGNHGDGGSRQPAVRVVACLHVFGFSLGDDVLERERAIREKAFLTCRALCAWCRVQKTHQVCQCMREQSRFEEQPMEGVDNRAPSS
jgi:hypothetical protein